MLILTVGTEDYLMIGDKVKVAFLGGSKNHLRVLVDAPREISVVRSKVYEKNIEDPEEKKKLPHYYAEPDPPEKYRKPKGTVNPNNNPGKKS